MCSRHTQKSRGEIGRSTIRCPLSCRKDTKIPRSPRPRGGAAYDIAHGQVIATWSYYTDLQIFSTYSKSHAVHNSPRSGSGSASGAFFFFRSISTVSCASLATGSCTLTFSEQLRICSMYRNCGRESKHTPSVRRMKFSIKRKQSIPRERATHPSLSRMLCNNLLPLVQVMRSIYTLGLMRSGVWARFGVKYVRASLGRGKRERPPEAAKIRGGRLHIPGFRGTVPLTLNLNPSPRGGGY